MRVPSPPCLVYYSGVLFGDDDHISQRAQRMVTLEFIALTMSEFLQIVRHCVTTQYNGGRVFQACAGRETLVPLNKRICTILSEYGIVRVLSCFDVGLMRGFIVMARGFNINFDTKVSLGRFLYNFDDSVVSRVPTYESVNCESSFTHAEVDVRYWNEYAIDGLQ